MWAHPWQAHLHTLEEAFHKLLLLVDNGPDWPYTFLQMNNTMSHAPLSSEEHIGLMIDGMPSTNACSWLHQLQVWKLLQHGGQVVFAGLNGELKAVQLTFQELPPLNATTVDEPTRDLPVIEVDLIHDQPDSMTTAFSHLC